MSIHGPAFDRAERAYLEPPDERFPPGVEDALGAVIMWPDGPDEDSLVPEFGEVTDWEEDEGFVTLTVTRMFNEDRPEVFLLDLDKLDEHAVPEDLKPIVEMHAELERAEQKLRGLRNRLSNCRAEVGRQAMREREEREYAKNRPYWMTDETHAELVRRFS